jgi:hypothetical protein
MNILAFKAIQLSSGVYIVAAHEEDKNNSCILLCIAKDGSQLWQKELPASIHRVTDITPTADTNFLIAAYNDSDLTQVFVEKYNVKGSLIWSNSFVFPPLGLVALVVTSADNGSIIMATTSGFTGIVSNTYFLTLNSAGQLITTLPIAGLDPTIGCFPMSILKQNDGYIISGYYNNISGNYYQYPYDYFCLKTDLNGAMVWKYLDTLNIMYLHQQKYILFNIYSSDNSGNGLIQLLTKTDSTTESFLYVGQGDDVGNIGQTCIGYTCANFFNSSSGKLTATKVLLPDSFNNHPLIAPSPDNGQIIAVTTNVNSSQTYYNSHILLVKTDAGLNVAWKQQLPIPDPAKAVAVFANTDGTYVVIAQVQSFNKFSDFAFIKTDDNGILK